MSFNIPRQFGLQFFFLLMSLSGFYIMIMLDSCTLEKFGKTFLHNVFVKPSGFTVFSLRNLKIMYSGNSLVVQGSLCYAFTVVSLGSIAGRETKIRQAA